MRLLANIAVAILLVCVIFSVSSAAAPLDDVNVPDLRERLAGLSPDDPMEYFRLGEEVAYESRGDRAVRLARRLYILAFELDSSGRLGRSVCLALAELSVTDQERRWLLAMAEALDQRSGPARWSRLAAGSDGGEAVEILTTGLARFHTGSYRQVYRALEHADVQRLAETLPQRDQRVVEMMKLELQRGGVCRECQNKRVIASGDDDIRLCPLCGGDPGPRLSPEELISAFGLEARLREVSTDQWSVQIAMDVGAPLRDVDPDELSSWFGIDPTRPYWRDGGWSHQSAQEESEPTGDAADGESSGPSENRQDDGPDLP